MPQEAGDDAECSPGVAAVRKRLSGFETEEGRLKVSLFSISVFNSTNQLEKNSFKQGSAVHLPREAKLLPLAQQQSCVAIHPPPTKKWAFTSPGQQRRKTYPDCDFLPQVLSSVLSISQLYTEHAIFPPAPPPLINHHIVDAWIFYIFLPFFLQGLAFKPKPEDVLIVTTPKAGTTWMQQICHQVVSSATAVFVLHIPLWFNFPPYSPPASRRSFHSPPSPRPQLRTNGSMDFEEISGVVPFLELAADQGQDLEALQVAQPRCYKTHLWYDHCPKGGRYIVVVRNPADVVTSFYKFFLGWFIQPGEVDLPEFVEHFWLRRGAPSSPMQNASYFHHLTSWWPHRLDENVLWVFFEDMIDNLRETVERVDRFLGLQSPEDRLQKAVDHSTFEFMRAHDSQFDEHLGKLARNAACGLPPDAGLSGSKLDKGVSGKGKDQLGPDLMAKIEAKWKEVVTPVTGYADYAALRQGLRQELKANNRW